MVTKITCKNCKKEISLKGDHFRLIIEIKKEGKKIKKSFCSFQCAQDWLSTYSKAEEKEEKLEEEVEEAIEEQKKEGTEEKEIKIYEKPEEIIDAKAQYKELRDMIYKEKNIPKKEKGQMIKQLNKAHSAPPPDTAQFIEYDPLTNKFRKIEGPKSIIDKLKELNIIKDIYTRGPG